MTSANLDVKFIDANGLCFGYLEEGTGPLVILLHGFPDTAHTWDEVRPALAKAGFRAVSPFMRGYAPTAIPSDGKYDSVTLGHDVLALIAALGEERAIVVGHDWGASAAYASAILGPQRVRFLVTVAIPHPAALKPSLRLLWGGRHFIRFQSRSAEDFTRKNNFAYIDALVRRWSPAWQVPPQETAAVKAAFAQPGCLTAALGYYRAARRAAAAGLRRQITMPSATFCGTDDGVLLPEDFEKARPYFDAPHELVVMPGGHFLHREHPAQFIEALLRIVKSAS